MWFKSILKTWQWRNSALFQCHLPRWKKILNKNNFQLLFHLPSLAPSDFSLLPSIYIYIKKAGEGRQKWVGGNPSDQTKCNTRFGCRNTRNASTNYRTMGFVVVRWRMHGPWLLWLYSDSAGMTHSGFGQAPATTWWHTLLSYKIIKGKQLSISQNTTYILFLLTLAACFRLNQFITTLMIDWCIQVLIAGSWPNQFRSKGNISFTVHTIFVAGNKKQLGTTFVAQNGTTVLNDTARPCKTKACIHTCISTLTLFCSYNFTVLLQNHYSPFVVISFTLPLEGCMESCDNCSPFSKTRMSQKQQRRNFPAHSNIHLINYVFFNGAYKSTTGHYAKITSQNTTFSQQTKHS